MRFQIRLADKIIEIRSKYGQIKKYCRLYTINDELYEDPDIIIETCPNDLRNIQKKKQQVNLKEDCVLQVGRSGPMLTTTRESPHTATKTQLSHKQINKKNLPSNARD